MKQIGLLSFLLGMGIIFTYSQDTIVSIPDTAFFNALIEEGVDTNGDGLISFGEAEAVISLDVSGVVGWGVLSGGIKSMEGIEAFMNLDTLNCYANEISLIDVSRNEDLRFINCSYNRISSLDISKNQLLETLIVQDNQLNSINLTENTSLLKLNCNSNKLVILDVSSNVKLESLECHSNQINDLNITYNHALNNLNVDDCPLQELDISKNLHLKKLVGSGTQISNLEISNYLELEELVWNDGSLKSLSIADCQSLKDLSFSSNEISTFHVVNCPALKSIDCGGNPLSKLDVSTFPLLEDLKCRNNDLAQLDVSGLNLLEVLSCSGNRLTTINVSHNPMLVVFNCGYNQLTYLNVSDHRFLTNLSCERNDITELNLTNCTELRWLDCSHNKLSNLDLSSNSNIGIWEGQYINFPALKLNDMPSLGAVCTTAEFHRDSIAKDFSSSPNVYFTTECFYNNDSIVFFPDTAFLHALIDEGVDTNGDSLISYEEAEAINFLDVSGSYNDPGNISSMTGIEAFVNLDTLYCFRNNLNNLDLSNNLALIELACDDNQLSSLDLSNNTALTNLDCNNNLLKSLDLSNNAAIEILGCGHNQLTSLDVSGCKALRGLSCNDNRLTNLDVSSNINLEGYLGRGPHFGLICNNNQLTSLDISKNPKLCLLHCGANQLTTLDVSSNQNLSELDVSGMPSLVRICGWDELDFPARLDIDMWGSHNIYFAETCEDIIVEVPDTAFLFALIDEGIDLNRDSLISTWEADLVTSLDVRWWGISNLTGIEAFGFLDSLDCSYNKLKSVDLSSNKTLSYLDISSNELSNLDISNNPHMRNLGIRFNPDLGEVCLSRMPFPGFPNFALDIISYGSDNFYFSDCVAPELAINHDVFYQPEIIQATCTEIGSVYLVPSGTAKDIQAIRQNCVIDSILVSKISIVSNDTVKFEIPIPDTLPNGVYWIYAKDKSGNISTELEIRILGVGIESKVENGIRVFPNPARTQLSIETQSPGHYSIEITSLNGQMIYSNEWQGTIHQLDLSSFECGVYFITMRSKDLLLTRKIVKL